MTIEEFKAWLTHPVTIAVWSYLEEEREYIKECIAAGAFLKSSNDEAVMQLAEAIGGCKVLRNLLDISFDDIRTKQELDNVN